jgi:hypothetical protein
MSLRFLLEHPFPFSFNIGMLSSCTAIPYDGNRVLSGHFLGGKASTFIALTRSFWRESGSGSGSRSGHENGN